MAEQLERFLNLDIPEELNLSRNIQTMVARATAANVSPDETAKVVVAVVVGNLMEIENRLVALEKQAGITPAPPRYSIG
ncbi:hypothetical protein PT015_23285 [Candidatus Mycobacterium wuenschmannii]|uniref:Transposase n=1 Tax=Candidatus Mycobacterium wuenschmannii TaxID=3027808 RepID=A0ABY8VVU3_9MYCO|nr:hypothetical protein [Candidatus Mycobacterium wuenschmannii]WIM87718.1 hypothetical protein PT015_23285 [Candidatus Mycobacterium wuenschmannii]